MTEQNEHYDPYEHEPMPEGEEGAPPLTHTMAIVRWIILAGMCLFAAIMIVSYFGAATREHSAKAAVEYNCPMHPTYVSKQPGDCPICGMSLVPMSKQGSAAVGAGGGGKAAGPAGTASDQAPGEGRPSGAASASDQSMANMPGMEGTSESPSGHEATMPEMGSSPVPGLVPVTLEPKRLQLIDVRTGKVERRSLGGATNIVGFVTPDETRITNLHLRFSGWVKDLNVDQTGQAVKRGERLLSVYSQDLYQAEQDYAVALAALDRGSKDSELADTRRGLADAARQRLELLGVPDEEVKRLDETRSPSQVLWVNSPFSGYVMEKNVFAGQYIGADQNLFSIVDLSKVWVLADVYEQDLSNVKVGQKASMKTVAYEGETFAGRIGFIYPSVSPETRTLKVRIEFDNPQLRLRPGMYSEILLEGSRESVLAVPSDAVMDDGVRQYAFVVHNGVHFEPRLLKVGRRSNDFIQILSGLSEGELVVTSANFLIDSESRLRAAITGMGGTGAGEHAGHTM